MFNIYKPVIAGIGETEIGKLYDFSILGLHTIAANESIKDADIEWELVDGLITSESIVEKYPRFALTVAEYLGITNQLTYVNTIQLGGASTFVGVAEAWRLVKEGICKAVLVIGADKPRTGHQREQSIKTFYENRLPNYEQPYGLSNVAAYAMLAQHYQEKYHSTLEQFAEVAVTFREYARNNDKAVYKDPLTVEDVINSKIICSPLRLYECSPVTDGGGAILITREEFTKRKPVRLEGYGYGFTHDNFIQIPNLVNNGSALSSKRAFEMAGIGIKDIDFAEIYDSYTITLLLELENIGICEPGTAADFVAQGNLKIDGILPTNTHGGLLSHSHCGNCSGIFHLTEGIKQLRGEAGFNQVEKGNTALIHGEGGIISANCTLILSNS